MDPAAQSGPRTNPLGTAALVAGILLVVTMVASRVNLFFGGGPVASRVALFGAVEIVLALAATGLGIAGLVRGGRVAAAGIGLGLGAATVVLSVVSLAFGAIAQL